MVDVSKTLQAALQQLRIEQTTLDNQIAALERAVDGMESQTTRRAGARETWLADRRAVRKQARVAAEPTVTPSDAGASPAAGVEASTGGQRLYGVEVEGELAELSQVSAAAMTVDDEAAVFGRYVDKILAVVDLSGKDLEAVARTLARELSGYRCECEAGGPDS